MGRRYVNNLFTADYQALPDFLLVLVGESEHLGMRGHASAVHEAAAETGRKEGEVQTWAHTQTLQLDVETWAMVHLHTHSMFSSFYQIFLSFKSKAWCKTIVTTLFDITS